MITLDTNIVVRILVDDVEQPEQTQKARALVMNETQVYVPQIVQVESIWGLQRVYKLDKSEILGVLEHLYQNPAFVLQYANIFSKAIDL